MKRAKLMLSAIAILAIVGGAFAFKARSTDFVYTGPAGGLGTSKVLRVTLTAPGFGTPTNATLIYNQPVIATSTIAGA